MKKISLLVAMKNEAETLDFFFATLSSVLVNLKMDLEIICVNDGSTDNTLSILLAHQKENKAIKIIDLSRNFGKEAALYAAFEHCTGEAAIALDADLQDPPDLIMEMVDYWEQGYDVVTAVRSSRKSDTWTKRKTAGLFYRIINFISDVKLTHNAGDFRLLDRCAINAFLSLKEKVRFNKGLLTWVGFKEQLIYHERAERVAGKSNWNYWKLFKFSLDGITSFSKTPLEIWMYLGLIISFFSFIYGAYYIVKTLIFGIDVPGYPSLLLFVLFFSGLQMIGIGMLGQYIGRIFVETKQRPIYVVRKIYT